MFDRGKKQQLIERQLGLRHKLKVNEAGPTPQNHKEMASLAVANGELDDEIAAIDEFLAMIRDASRSEKLQALIKEHGDPRSSSREEAAAGDSASRKAKPKKA